ncbi:MAG: ATP-binding protein [Fibrobacteres bacterium]|nr:ATP-binding protein [Fibrobacterota bacterium]
MTEEKKFPCTLESLEAMRDFIEAFAKKSSISASSLTELVLAVNEAVTNIMEHGGVDGSKDSYSVNMELLPSELVVTVRDPGRQYDPNSLRTASSGADIKKRRPRSGMGVYLIRQLVDGIMYHRDSNENVLKFIKNI